MKNFKNYINECTFQNRNCQKIYNPDGLVRNNNLRERINQLLASYNFFNWYCISSIPIACYFLEKRHKKLKVMSLSTHGRNIKDTCWQNWLSDPFDSSYNNFNMRKGSDLRRDKYNNICMKITFRVIQCEIPKTKKQDRNKFVKYMKRFEKHRNKIGLFDMTTNICKYIYQVHSGIQIGKNIISNYRKWLRSHQRVSNNPEWKYAFVTLQLKATNFEYVSYSNVNQISKLKEDSSIRSWSKYKDNKLDKIWFIPHLNGLIFCFERNTNRVIVERFDPISVNNKPQTDTWWSNDFVTKTLNENLTTKLKGTVEINVLDIEKQFKNLIPWQAQEINNHSQLLDKGIVDPSGHCVLWVLFYFDLRFSNAYMNKIHSLTKSKPYNLVQQITSQLNSNGIDFTEFIINYGLTYLTIWTLFMKFYEQYNDYGCIKRDSIQYLCNLMKNYLKMLEMIANKYATGAILYDPTKTNNLNEYNKPMIGYFEGRPLLLNVNDRYQYTNKTIGNFPKVVTRFGSKCSRMVWDAKLKSFRSCLRKRSKDSHECTQHENDQRPINICKLIKTKALCSNQSQCKYGNRYCYYKDDLDIPSKNTHPYILTSTLTKKKLNKKLSKKRNKNKYVLNLATMTAHAQLMVNMFKEAFPYEKSNKVDVKWWNVQMHSTDYNASIPILMYETSKDYDSFYDKYDYELQNNSKANHKGRLRPVGFVVYQWQKITGKKYDKSVDRVNNTQSNNLMFQRYNNHFSDDFKSKKKIKFKNYEVSNRIFYTHNAQLGLSQENSVVYISDIAIIKKAKGLWLCSTMLTKFVQLFPVGTKIAADCTNNKSLKCFKEVGFKDTHRLTHNTDTNTRINKRVTLTRLNNVK